MHTNPAGVAGRELTLQPHCAGLVQTPGADEGQYYQIKVDLWSDISPPPGHVTLVSVPLLDLHSYADRLELREGVELWSPRLFTARRSQTIPAAVYRSRVLHVHFVSGPYAEKSRGFRLLFTYHRVRERPSSIASQHRTFSSISSP